MTQTMTANTDDVQVAASLAEIGDVGDGNLVSLKVRKRGVTRGPAGSKVTYEDDLVHVLIWTGFHYKALVERSHKKLHELWGRGDLVGKLFRETVAAGQPDTTVRDIAEAIQEIDDSLSRVLVEKKDEVEVDEDPETKNDPVWEPLVVDGVKILGAKVYVGHGDSMDPERGPQHGTVYIDGVKLGEKIVEPSANGKWRPSRKPKSVAKDLLRAKLPAGRYVRYSLNPEFTQSVHIGKEASADAKRGGVPVNPEAIRSLFKIAP
jgi:hypothetical protein